MRTFLSFCLLLLVTTSCAKTSKVPIVQKASYSTYTRPKVALVPITQSSSCLPETYPKHHQNQITKELLDIIVFHNNLSLLPYFSFKEALEETKDVDYFGLDTSYASHFDQADFLLVAEVAEHKLVPYTQEKFPSLSPFRGYGKCKVQVVSLRLRAFDLRYEEPRLILQELLTKEALVSEKEQRIDYMTLQPSHPNWQITPCGKLYQELAKEAAEQIECTLLSHW